MPQPCQGLTGLAAASALAVCLTSSALGANGSGSADGQSFARLATFEIVDNDPNADRSSERVAEIVDATADGQTLVYTDSEGEQIGLLDIADPANPRGLGVLSVGGEPTSVAVAGPYALVGVNTSKDFKTPSGELVVVNIWDPAAPFVVRRISVAGQPDSVAVSPDLRYAAVVIENERDEDLEDAGLTPNEGGLPQLPAGLLNIVDLAGAPDTWTLRQVALTGLAEVAPSDPEPEFVDINANNIAAVTLQENNHVVLVSLRSGRTIDHFSAGSVTLEDVDNVENKLVELSATLSDIPREPDAIAWVDTGTLATANEGDMLGGGRGFTLFDKRGHVTFETRAAFDHLAVRLGHYPEDRSENKGSEPEGVEVGRYGDDTMLFVAAERSGFVAVYRIGADGQPKFTQVLPTGIGPEGLKAIPQRGLFVVASEKDDPAKAKDKKAGFRSTITIYGLQDGPPSYPTIVSANTNGLAMMVAGTGVGRHAGVRPIAWAALSGLAGDRDDPDTLFAVHDSFYNEARIYEVDTRRTPAVIVDQIVLKKDGATVNRDLEGLVQRANGGFWAVSEGSGSVDDAKRPVKAPNRLIEVARDGTVTREVELPASVNALQRRFGFEGVTVVGEGPSERVYVAFQRQWVDDPANRVRVGVFNPNDGTWRFFLYPIETPIGGLANAWVGLSEIVSLGNDRFAVIERDNLIGADAAIKRLYTFSTAGITPKTQDEGGFETVRKSLALDVLPLLRAPNGAVMDKPEGLTVAADGQVYLVTDNDGVDDSPGETQFLRLGSAADVFGR